MLSSKTTTMLFSKRVALPEFYGKKLKNNASIKISLNIANCNKRILCFLNELCDDCHAIIHRLARNFFWPGLFSRERFKETLRNFRSKERQNLALKLKVKKRQRLTYVLEDCLTVSRIKHCFI